MTELKSLLELRERIKEKKPDFIRQDYQRRKRLGRKLKWRKPKGIHSKIRHHFKGRRKMPSPGYKSPKKVRWLHTSGFKKIVIFSLQDILKINNENEGIVISKKIGMKKKFEILKKAKELDIKVLNLNIDEQIKIIQEFINSKKKSEIKASKKEETIKEKQSEKLSDEQKKEYEKKEKDKLLTKRM